LVRLGMLPGAHALPQGSMCNAGGRAGAIAHRGLPEGTADRPVDSEPFQDTEHGGVHPGEERRRLARRGDRSREARRSTRSQLPAPEARTAQQREQRTPARRGAPQDAGAARAHGSHGRRARLAAIQGPSRLRASIGLARKPAAARDADPQRHVGPGPNDAQGDRRRARHAMERRAQRPGQHVLQGPRPWRVIPGTPDAARPGRMCAALRARRRPRTEHRALHAFTDDPARTV